MGMTTLLVVTGIWGTLCFIGGLLVGRKHSKELEKTIAEIRRLQGR